MASNRFGISALSKSKYAEAYNEEILVDKSIGEFLIKTPNGELVSYDRNSRLACSYNDVKKIMANHNLYGDLVTADNEISFPKLFNISQFPASHTLDEPITISDIHSSRLLLYMNYDFLAKTSDTPAVLTSVANDAFDLTVSCTISFETGVSPQTINVPITGYVSNNILTSYAEHFTSNISSIQITNLTANGYGLNPRPHYLLLNHIGVIVEA